MCGARAHAGLSQADLETFNAASYSFFNMHPELAGGGNAPSAAPPGLGLEDELEGTRQHGGASNSDADCDAAGLSSVLDGIGLSVSQADTEQQSRSAP